MEGFRLIDSNLFQWDFPGGSVVENPPSNAGDMGWGTKIPHVMGQLSPTHNTATTKPVQYLWHVGLVAHMPQVERSPPAITKTQGSQ